MKISILVSCAAILLSGCTTLADAKLAKGTGQRQTYDASYEPTWKATVCSLNAKGLQIASENKAENTILAQRGMTAFSYGENIAVFVRKVSKKQTEVEVVSKKVMETNIFAPNWSKDILSGIEACL